MRVDFSIGVIRAPPSGYFTELQIEKEKSYSSQLIIKRNVEWTDVH